MGAIAVAGGTGPVGKTIVDALVAADKHKIYVLCRKAPAPRDGVTYLPMDYADIEATSQALQGPGIDTLICAIGMTGPEAQQSQLNLIRAAEKSASTRRFLMSSFDMLYLKEHTEISQLARYAFEAIEALEKTGLEYTRVANGWFSDYYGMPHWKSYLHSWVNVLDMSKTWAAVPGDGSAEATFITTQDMAKCVARIMDMDEWPKVCCLASETLSFNELVKLAEDARGSKFDVAYDSLEKLKGGNISFADQFPVIGFGDGDEAFYALLHYQAGIGQYRIPDGSKFDEKWLGEKMTTVAEVMNSSWKGREKE